MPVKDKTKKRLGSTGAAVITRMINRRAGRLWSPFAATKTPGYRLIHVGCQGKGWWSWAARVGDWLDVYTPCVSWQRGKSSTSREYSVCMYVRVCTCTVYIIHTLSRPVSPSERGPEYSTPYFGPLSLSRGGGPCGAETPVEAWRMEAVFWPLRRCDRLSGRRPLSSRSMAGLSECVRIDRVGRTTRVQCAARRRSPFRSSVRCAAQSN